MTDLTKSGPMGLNGLTACEASAKIEKKEITSEELVRECLDRIEARDPLVQAWDFIDPNYALEQARALDGEEVRRGPLHGVPVAIKDIFDTKDMPTGHGFPPYKGAASNGDSTCVSQLRDAGMVILGKSVTTEFACPSPRKTVNPHDFSRTPGVSSSGSAAAVADFMVPLANGTQTGGSVIGPAANCGVYGFKASLDGINRGGLRHCKPSIDTIGLFARSLEDLVLMYSVQTARRSVEATDTLRIGIVRTSDWNETEPCMQKAILEVGKILGKTGAVVSEVELPQIFTDIIPDFSIVNGWEATVALETEISNHLDSFNPHNRERVEFVSGLTEVDYKNSMKVLSKARLEMDRLFESFDLFLSPALSGEAPIGLTEVRTATFARLWTQMYTPSVCVPISEGPNGLPVCVQMIGSRNSDQQTLANAKQVDDQLKGALGEVPSRV